MVRHRDHIEKHLAMADVSPGPINVRAILTSRGPDP